MPEIEVIRHVVRPHQHRKSEEYDPSQDMLIVVHRNPNDPDDPTEFGHHMRMEGLSYRKEMLGLAEYADVIDQEIRDLERFYFWDAQKHSGDHPLADITEHYYEGPPDRMKSFAPDYLLDQVDQLSAVGRMTTDSAMRMAADVVLTGLDDVRGCLAAKEGMEFACRGMTSLSADSAAKRRTAVTRITEQSSSVTLKSTKGLDDLKQLLTDRGPELEPSRERFVNHALIESNVPALMMTRVKQAVERRTGRKLPS